MVSYAWASNNSWHQALLSDTPVWVWLKIMIGEIPWYWYQHALIQPSTSLPYVRLVMGLLFWSQYQGHIQLWGITCSRWILFHFWKSVTLNNVLHYVLFTYSHCLLDILLWTHGPLPMGLASTLCLGMCQGSQLILASMACNYLLIQYMIVILSFGTSEITIYLKHF